MEILFASSYDENFPPTNILTSQSREFFVTTGLYPQEICIQLENERTLTSVGLTTHGVKRIAIETCENETAVNFLKQAEMNDVPFKEGKLQELILNMTAYSKVKVLKVVISEGYDDFCTIHTMALK